jgi:hypothetical protein
MNLFGHDIAFWFAAFGSAALKIALSPWMGVWQGIISIGSALFCAIVFTAPVLNYLNMDPETYKAALAALIALTGESIVRSMLQLVTEPGKLAEMIKSIRGGGGK